MLQYFSVSYLNNESKKNLETLSFKLVDERESYPDLNLSNLYDPKKMPLKLKNLHEEIDQYIEGLYSNKILKFDEDKINLLFNMYQNHSKNKNFF